MSKKETWGEGLLFLSTIKQAYKPQLASVELMEKERDYLMFYQFNTQSIDEFGARSITAREEIQEHIPTTDEGLRKRFIMGLGPLFTEI